MLNSARTGHTATLLPNGKVLVAGGMNGSNYLPAAELYDPATRTWATTGSLNTGRTGHTATLLPSGRVLVAGGYNTSSGQLASAELYDPASGTWATTGSLNIGRENHSATLLPNGDVLIAGGYYSYYGVCLYSSELYDPANETWTTAGSLNFAREYHTATLLPNGRVLVIGGYNGSSNGSALGSTELCDATSGDWTFSGALQTAPQYHTATLLPTGKVLIVAGQNGGNVAQLYDPITGTALLTGSLHFVRYNHTATLLPNGQVLVPGGNYGYYPYPALSSSEIYDPVAGIWPITNSMTANRVQHTSTLLPNGKVLVAGGYYSPPGSAELYDPASSTWMATGTMNTPRGAHTATLLPNGGSSRHWGVQRRLDDKRGTIRFGRGELDGDRRNEHRPGEPHSDLAAQWKSAGCRGVWSI